jgi:P-type E1-E2 ATPase
MARKNVLCKKLQIIETFGAATIIASDKTGTLTKNDMTVTEVWYDKRTESIDKSRKRAHLITVSSVWSIRFTLCLRGNVRQGNCALRLRACAQRRNVRSLRN